MPFGKFLTLTGILGLTLMGCQSTEPQSFNISTPRGEWSIRLVAEDDPANINYLYLDPVTGSISLECRYWDRNGQCSDGRHFYHDTSETFTYLLELVDGDTTSPLPVPNIQYSVDRKILARQQFEEGTTKVTFTDRFEYDLAGRLAKVRQYADFINGDLVKTWNFSYNTTGRLDTVSIVDASSQAEIRIRYTYDSSGRLEQAMKNIGYGFKLERDAQGRITRLVRFHPDATTPSAWRVEYRASTIAFEPDPVKDFFMPDPFSVYP